MPDTVINRVNELYCNKTNQFIFTDRSGFSIGDIDITGVDKDNAYSHKNKFLQDSPHNFQKK